MKGPGQVEFGCWCLANSVLVRNENCPPRLLDGPARAQLSNPQDRLRLWGEQEAVRRRRSVWEIPLSRHQTFPLFTWEALCEREESVPLSHPQVGDRR